MPPSRTSAFGGGSPFQAQQPFQSNTWRIGNIGGGFQVSNPFGGQNPFNVSNFQQTPSAQTSGDSRPLAAMASPATL